MRHGTSTVARIAAPAAFLLAATVFVLLVRSALEPNEPAAVTEPVPAQTEPAEAEPETQPPATGPAETGPAETAGETLHVIQSGDTLETIASQYGTTVERLLELNPGIDPVALTVGERIRVL